MANLTYSSELLDDILFRSDELTDGTSDHESQALVYLNRAYRSLYMGGVEFFPDGGSELWWWLNTGSSNIIMQPTITTGTISVTNNNASVTFSGNITPDLTDGWYLKVDDHPDIFKFSVHGGNQNSATLDSVYTGDTDTAASYRLMKLEYDLASDVLYLSDKMHCNQDSQYDVHGMALSQMKERYPLHLLDSGVPNAFAPVSETRVMFNSYGSTSGDYIRVDYDYLKRPADLTDSAAEEPIVPLQYRHVLADMAVYFIHMDKENDRMNLAYNQAKGGIMAMKKENRSRHAKIGEAGRIYTRQSNYRYLRRTLRTESGIILG